MSGRSPGSSTVERSISMTNRRSSTMNRGSLASESSLGVLLKRSNAEMRDECVRSGGNQVSRTRKEKVGILKIAPGRILKEFKIAHGVGVDLRQDHFRKDDPEEVTELWTNLRG